MMRRKSCGMWVWGRQGSSTSHPGQLCLLFVWWRLHPTTASDTATATPWCIAPHNTTHLVARPKEPLDSGLGCHSCATSTECSAPLPPLVHYTTQYHICCLTQAATPCHPCHRGALPVPQLSWLLHHAAIQRHPPATYTECSSTCVPLQQYNVESFLRAGAKWPLTVAFYLLYNQLEEVFPHSNLPTGGIRYSLSLCFLGTETEIIDW